MGNCRSYKVAWVKDQDSGIMMGSPKCGCGKTQHPPYCDGSHARTPEQLKEWAEKIARERKIQ